MSRHWKLVLVAGVIAAVMLSAAAVAVGAGQSWLPRGEGAKACGAVMGNPEAFEAMQGLRSEHAEEMRSWYEAYGDRPASREARAALRRLRSDHWNDMRSLLEKYGVTLPPGAGRGAAGGGCAAGCGGPTAGGRAEGVRSGMGPGGGMMKAWSY